MLSGGNETAARAIEKGYRTARRHKGSWMAITQGIDDFFASAEAKAAFNSSDNKIIILLMINLILLFVGIFMDITPAVLIFTPIFLPVIKSIGIDPIQFGIIMVVNLCIGLCTPPVGSVLFVGVGISKTSIEKVIKPLLPLFIAMIVALGLITYFPEITLWLPEKFGF